MNFSPIAITGLGSVSALGFRGEEILENYKNPKHFFQHNGKHWMAKIPFTNDELLRKLHFKNDVYTQLDRTVILALLAVEQLLSSHNLDAKQTGISIGSSRGATELWEQHYKEFHTNHKVHTLASPTTSLGNISSWIAQHIGSLGFHFDHSMTCSSSFFSILNAIAWLQSDMTERVVAGGSEASLTDFTIAQLKALRIYSQETDAFPNKAGFFQKKQNTMALGEGCALISLEKSNHATHYIKSYGFCTEKIAHAVSLSQEANNCQQAMKMALHSFELHDIDVIITHTPGTKQGDLAEWKAIETIFGTKIPLITNNKWKIGHTFGASGILSLEMALLMLKNQLFFPILGEKYISKSIKNVLINTLGFGGNAVSIIVGK